MSFLTKAVYSATYPVSHKCKGGDFRCIDRPWIEAQIANQNPPATGVMAQIELQGALNEAQGIGRNIGIRSDVVWGTKPHYARANSTANRKHFTR